MAAAGGTLLRQMQTASGMPEASLLLHDAIETCIKV
jgi:hypothetical protein